MYTKKMFGAGTMALWTRVETMQFIGISIIEVLLFYLSDGIVQIPFTPVALVGTAVAFIIGFQSNAAYGRIWEGRQIWGSIVNSSRTFGMMVQDFVNNDHTHDPVSKDAIQQEIKVIIYRHIAWLTALRYAMRQPKPWEYVMQERTNKEWAKTMNVPEFYIPFEDALEPYLSTKEKAYLKGKDNKQTAILFLQSHHLRELKERGLLWEFSFLELENLVGELFTHQGKSERIKNFPYPRQFASLLHYFTWIFILILPIAIVGQFAEIGYELADKLPGAEQWFLWLAVPFASMIMWIFHTMNRIGRVGENPFEGSTNDVPISTIARGIEIDLRQNLGEDLASIPKQFEAKNDTQM